MKQALNTTQQFVALFMGRLILLPQPFAVGALAIPSPNQCLLQRLPRPTSVLAFLPLLNEVPMACSG